MVCKRFDIHWVELDPARGSELRQTRPAVIVSNDGANTTATRLSLGVVTVVPVTSNVERVYPFQVLLPAHPTGLSVDSKAQAEQVRSVDIERAQENLFERASLRPQMADLLVLFRGQEPAFAHLVQRLHGEALRRCAGRQVGPATIS